jgi:teichuronic acid biosynthesis glycosyltransferase TuaG
MAENNSVAPKVSVVMPAYNMEPYIAQSIESVIKQDFENWELLIVDDGSKDNTLAISQAYEKKDTRIKCFHKENGGLPSARNHAIERAQGELLALLDSDDLWLPNKLSVSVAEFDKGDQDLLFTNGYNFTTESNIEDVETLKKFPLHKGVFVGESGLKEFIKGNKVHVPTVLVKKEVIVKLGGFPAFNFAEDYCMWLLMLVNGYKLRGIENALSLYRERPDSMLHSAKKIFVKFFRLFEYIIKKYPVFIKYKKELKHFLRLYIIFDYDRSNLQEFRHIMKILNIESPFINYIIFINPILPDRIERKLLRMVL